MTSDSVRNVEEVQYGGNGLWITYEDEEGSRSVEFEPFQEDEDD